MRPFLPYLFLVDVVGDQPRFRFRLVGTKVVEACGADRTGDYFDHVDFAAWHGEDEEEYVAAVIERLPRARSWDMAEENLHLLRYERLILPLSNDGERINMLLCGMAVEDLGSIATAG